MCHPTGLVEVLPPQHEADVAVEVEAPTAYADPPRLCEEITVLVVDDEPGILRISRRILSRLGYRVLECSGGMSALRLIETYPGPIHLLITDLVMPGMNGQELIEHSRLIRPEMKVLCVSGSAEGAALRRVLEDPEIEFLSKPYSPLTFRASVEIVMNGCTAAVSD